MALSSSIRAWRADSRRADGTASIIRYFENASQHCILSAGLKKEDHMKRYTLSMIGLALVTAIIANPGIALACNKLIGT